MLSALLASLVLSQAPVAAPAPNPPSAAEWAAHVDRKLLSFVLEPMPVVRSKEKRIEVGGLISFSDELEAVLADVPEAAITIQGAQRSLRVASFMAIAGGGSILAAGGLLVGALLAASQTALIALAISSGVFFLAAITLTLVAASFAQNASRGLLLAIEQYNHGLLRPPPGAPPQVRGAGPEASVVVQQF
ncbi:MAG: hypothetical protein AB1938_04890 [Myxococcota bacterium]